MKVVLLLIAVCLFPARGIAGDTAPVTDPASIRQHYQTLLRQPQYQEPEEPALIRDWLSQWFSRLGAEFGRFKYTQEMPRLASLIMTVFVVLALAGLLYLLLRITRRRDIRDSSEDNLPARSTALRPPEFYEEELRRAVAAGEWREAWLASWRQFLSRLEQGRLVEADRSRTNREYLAQLSARPLPAAALPLLSRMVDLYDRFIYGRRPVSEPEWNSFRQQVDEATLLLHLRETPP
jgi:Domain of unknown function (DUF4129)